MEVHEAAGVFGIKKAFEMRQVTWETSKVYQQAELRTSCNLSDIVPKIRYRAS